MYRTHFVKGSSGTRFIPWGVNYDHDHSGRLIEDYWEAEWPTVVSDFKEIKGLGANVIRIHLQTGRFLKSPHEANQSNLNQLRKLLRLAEQTGIYLDLTGLACYHKQDLPDWFEALSEAERWEAQAFFWETISTTCARSPAVFCYDLMNEPILPGEGEQAVDWLTGELAGKFFVQRLALSLNGRTREQVAKAWVDKMVDDIRKQDNKHLVTLGDIPFNLIFPGAPLIFYTPEVSEKLDFVAVHFYPKRGEVDKALKAIAEYQIGKPILVEEMFPLECDVADLDAFIEGSRSFVDGWIGFYWGRTISEYKADGDSLPSALIGAWLEYFQSKSGAIRSLPNRH